MRRDKVQILLMRFFLLLFIDLFNFIISFADKIRQFILTKHYLNIFMP